MQQQPSAQKAQYLQHLMKVYQAPNLTEEQKRGFWQKIIQQATNESVAISQQELQQLVAHHLQQQQAQQQQQAAAYAAAQQRAAAEQHQQQQTSTSIGKPEPLASIPPPQHTLHQPSAIQQQRPHYHTIAPAAQPQPQPELPADPSLLVSKQKIQYLLSTIDPEMRIDDATCELLIDVAHEFVQEITDLSSKLAHHRGSDTLMVKDSAKIAERFYDIRIPGFNDDPEALTAAPQTVFDARGRARNTNAYSGASARAATRKVTRARPVDKNEV
ncbi:hypothetical protein SeLEV6574_g02380 [Synchytrium endobioticum]|uniref:Transcription initiation factor TFIID subunit 12 domain-containing protein n=1 Tax=Synchytrium endobioticum TaxID=286115 RepID=A0A507D8K9_9FUNG|nr:hypothetical protein SeLEV6574_g02380 [Synchytrium endobioticum]